MSRQHQVWCLQHQVWCLRALEIAADIDLVQRTRRAVDDEPELRELQAWEDELRDDARDLIADVEARGPFPRSHCMIEFLYGFVDQSSGMSRSIHM
jgi:hypothetical protein